MVDFDLSDVKSRMSKAIDSLKHDFGSLRTGRASANMLDSIQVDAYGSHVPLVQIAGVSVPEARLLVVTVWDANLVKSVEKAIVESRLGLTPQSEGNVLRLPVPEPSEERRLELAKAAGKYAEQGRVSVRTVRRDAMDILKRCEKDGDMSKDEVHRLSSQVQDATDEKVDEIDVLLGEKEKEITAI